MCLHVFLSVCLYVVSVHGRICGPLGKMGVGCGSIPMGPPAGGEVSQFKKVTTVKLFCFLFHRRDYYTYYYYY